LRNLWLSDFIEILFRGLYEDPKATMHHCAKEAYNKALGIHHPWAVRQAAKLALYAVPNRESFFTSANYTIEACVTMKVTSDKFRLPLWEYYRHLGINELE
jgi:hypothetical protein